MNANVGLNRLNLGANAAIFQPAIHPSRPGNTRTNSAVKSKVPFIAWCASRLTEEMKTPVTSEKNNVLKRSNTSRQNSPPVTPPRRNDKPITGNAANNP
jgi:hypothetical protein